MERLIKKKSGEASEKLSFETWKCFSLEIFWFVNENFPQMILDPLFLTHNVFVFLTPKLFSHSPKANGANEAQGVKIWGLYTCIGRKVGQKTPKYLLGSL